MAQTVYERRVSAGARHLDQTMPGWYKKINLEKLNIMTCGCCVYGQLEDGFSQARRCGEGGKQSIKHGVLVPYASRRLIPRRIVDRSVTRRYYALTKAWKREIKRRLHQQAA